MLKKCYLDICTWNGKPNKMKREFMKMPKAIGGMSVPDISLKNLALDTKNYK